jgi:hypothetical protein
MSMRSSAVNWGRARASASAEAASAESASSSAAASAIACSRARRVQLLDERLVEQLLARERPLARGKRLVLERLQLRRDVALGVLHRLAALVLHRHAIEVRLGDLDVEAVHPVELHAQVGDAGAFAFALLHVQEERAAVVLDRAQLVELRVAPVADDPTFADHGGRLVLEGGGEAREDSIGGRQRLRRAREPRLPARLELRMQVGECRQRVAQSREVAWARGAQRHARGDALDVRPGGEELGQARKAQRRS